MLARRSKEPPQINQFGAIQVQRLYCRPTCGGASDDEHEVIAPGKVP
jgi:hypothetical protein